MERRTPLRSYGYNSALRDPVMDAELGDSTGSLKVVHDRDGTGRLAEGFLEANRLVAKEHKLVMSAKQLRKGRMHCTLDHGTRRLITGRHGLLWCGSQLANLYPLLMQVLISVSGVTPIWNHAWYVLGSRRRYDEW